MIILEKNLNKLLSRIEIKAEISYDAVTPSNDAVKQQLAKKLPAKPELIVVKQILPVFGQRQSTVYAYVYNGEEALKRVERLKKKKEAKPGEAKEKPAEAKAEEKPAEQAPKAEEKSAEKKPAEAEKPAEEAKPEEKG